jgi:hypothetical protein
MARSRKSKKAPEKPSACRKLNLIGPKPVEEEEESSASDFDLPLNPFDDQGDAEADDEENVRSDEDESTSEEEETPIHTDEDLEEVQLPVKRKKIQKAAKKSTFHYSPLFCWRLLFFRENSEDWF